MKLKVRKIRYRIASGFFYTIDRRLFPFGWETLYHNGGWVTFGNRTWANEYVRLYNAIKRK